MEKTAHATFDLGPLSHVELMDWGIVDPSGDISKIPTVAQIKEAICRYECHFLQHAGNTIVRRLCRGFSSSTQKAITLTFHQPCCCHHRLGRLPRTRGLYEILGVYWEKMDMHGLTTIQTTSVGAHRVVVKMKPNATRKYEIKINLVKVTAPKSDRYGCRRGLVFRFIIGGKVHK